MYALSENNFPLCKHSLFIPQCTSLYTPNPSIEELDVTYEIAKWNFIWEGFMKFRPKILQFDKYIKANKRPTPVVIIMVYEPFTESPQNTQLLSITAIPFINFYQLYYTANAIKVNF